MPAEPESLALAVPPQKKSRTTPNPKIPNTPAQIIHRHDAKDVEAKDLTVSETSAPTDRRSSFGNRFRGVRVTELTAADLGEFQLPRKRCKIAGAAGGGPTVKLEIPDGSQEVLIKQLHATTATAMARVTGNKDKGTKSVLAAVAEAIGVYDMLNSEQAWTLECKDIRSAKDKIGAASLPKHQQLYVSPADGDTDTTMTNAVNMISDIESRRQFLDACGDLVIAFQATPPTKAQRTRAFFQSAIAKLLLVETQFKLPLCIRFKELDRCKEEVNGIDEPNGFIGLVTSSHQQEQFAPSIPYLLQFYNDNDLRDKIIRVQTKIIVAEHLRILIAAMRMYITVFS
jgi:hypothetical protein